jgi:hypothetical protein
MTSTVPPGRGSKSSSSSNSNSSSISTFLTRTTAEYHSGTFFDETSDDTFSGSSGPAGNLLF